MKTLLNLLPEEKKAAIQKQLRYRFLLWQTFLVVLLQVFYTSILVGIFFILDFQLSGYRLIGSGGDTSRTDERALADYEAKFRETNEAVLLADRLNRSHLHFSNIFVLLDRLLPEGITLETLDTRDRTVLLVGRATTRENLLVLDQKLKGSECIEQVNIPISNLFSEENIDFQMDFKIKDSCFKQTAL